MSVNLQFQSRLDGTTTVRLAWLELSRGMIDKGGLLIANNREHFVDPKGESLGRAKSAPRS